MGAEQEYIKGNHPDDLGRWIPEIIEISEGRSEGYQNWIGDGAYLLEKKLPFKGPADISITIGSGLHSVLDALEFSEEPVVIPYQDIGLPVGKVEGHHRRLVAGVTKSGKKVVVVDGRTHAYEIPDEGIETQNYGKLSRMELATGYLAMLNQIGVKNVVLLCAAGGIAHPLKEGQAQPFSPESLPQIGLIGSDLNLAYPNVHFGPFEGYGRVRFINLQDGNKNLGELFRRSMGKVSNIQVPTFHYVTSRSTPSFEDVGIVHDAARKRGQTVGMSYSYEKQYLSGADNIGRFIGIAVATNPLELVANGQDPRPGYHKVLTVNELDNYYPHELFISSPASHQEVLEAAGRVNEPLGKALADVVESLLPEAK